MSIQTLIGCSPDEHWRIQNPQKQNPTSKHAKKNPQIQQSNAVALVTQKRCEPDYEGGSVAIKQLLKLKAMTLPGAGF